MPGISRLPNARLPKRFPVGTRYVLEGVPAKNGKLQVTSRLLILPDGRQFDLTDETAQSRRRRARRTLPGRRRTKH